VRCPGSNGTREVVVETPARGIIADVKQLLCSPPHCIRSDASMLVLVLKGKGAHDAHASQFVFFRTFFLTS
jgi:hypothetical protein